MKNKNRFLKNIFNKISKLEANKSFNCIMLQLITTKTLRQALKLWLC